MTKKDYAKYFKYLDDLRDSGVTNMFESGSYVKDEFGVSQSEARDIVSRWMKSFDPGKSIADRVAAAGVE